MNDEQMKSYLASLGYVLFDDDGCEIWHELAINGGYKWSFEYDLWYGNEIDINEY